MSSCLFVSDLHGNQERYQKLFRAIENRRPRAVFLGGDLLAPWALPTTGGEGETLDFILGFLAPAFERLRNRLGKHYPRVFVILGNDDAKSEEEAVLEVAGREIWMYVQGRREELDDYLVFGYSYIPPTPFLLKDWERYDVSRYVDPGCVSPEEGRRSMPIPEREARYSTIEEDLRNLSGSGDLDKSVFLFHTPPYQTSLDRAALDGKQIDHAPLDIHVGSIAVKRFIQSRQPLVTLHGHVHESARLTGSWRDRVGRTHLFGAAHDGPELALVSFDLGYLDGASRELL